jgi:DNA repair exonuclease SbcCD ATPase subunit
MPIVQWPEFSNNFNSYWTRRSDIYEQWRQGQTSAYAVPESKIKGSTSGVNENSRSRLPPPGTNSDLSVSLRQAEVASVRVLEAELVEISERLRQTRYQLDEERQKRHQLRDDLEESRRLIDEERNRVRDSTKQLVVLEEDKMTHEIQVSRLREQIEQNMSLRETLQLDLDRTRMQLFHAREKYEAALTSMAADNEALRKKIEVVNLELQQAQTGGVTKRDLVELESQNSVLRQIVEKYRRALPVSRFADTADAASAAAFDAPKLASSTDFLNSLMEALDRAKFLNKQILTGADPVNNWSKQSWQDLCMGWRETVCELCDLFATAHRMENLGQVTQTSKTGS